MATRSPSPNSTRPINPNPKTPDSSNNLRKSGSFSLSKPSISTESHQRNSCSKASAALPSLRASFEQKENEKDPHFSNPARVRSPAVSSSKGSKNFMAPTISASSKAISPSPRKKILAERNEVISVSNSLELSTKEEIVPKSEMGFGALVDGVGMEEIAPKSEMGFDSSKAISPSPRKKILAERNEVISVSNSLELSTKEEIVLKSEMGFGALVDGVGMEEIEPKSEMGFDSREILGGAELKKVDSKIKNHQSVVVSSSSPSPVIAPLDSNPSLPPYDPKTNYLSPRPQFLHYKPNSRIQQYLNKGGDFLQVGDGKRLEDSFSSESSEDITILTEEKDSEEESFSTEVEEVESPHETHVAQPEFRPKPFKSRPFKRSKLVPILLVLVIACLYAPLSDSPIISSSKLKDPSLPKIYTPSLGVFEDLHLRDYLTVANVNLHELANRFRHWSIDSLSYFTSVSASVPKENFGLFHLLNLTSSAVDETVGLDFSSLESETELAIKENMVEEHCCGEHESEASEVVKDNDAEYEVEKMEMEVWEEKIEMGGTKFEAEKIETEDSEYDTEKIEMEVSEDVNKDDTEYGAEKIEMGVSEDVKDANSLEYEMEKEIEYDGRRKPELEKSHPINEAPNIEEEAGEEHKYSSHNIVVEPEIMEYQEDSCNANSINHIQFASFGDSQSESGEEYHTSHGLKIIESINYRVVLALSLALVVLAATLVFPYMKQKQSPMVTKERRTTKKVGSVSGSSETYTPAKYSPYQNLSTDVEMVGDSGPSELSSSLNTSSFGRHRTKSGKEEEILSHERRLRRDSAASSSISISYGSFTTYEKLSAKKGCADEEVVTPVRRSSRIRNQVTSP